MPLFGFEKILQKKYTSKSGLAAATKFEWQNSKLETNSKFQCFNFRISPLSVFSLQPAKKSSHGGLCLPPTAGQKPNTAPGHGSRALKYSPF